MVQTSPCSELHPYPQQASSTPTSIVPSSRGLGPGLPSLGVWGLTTLLLCSLDLGTCHHTHTNLSDLPPPGLNLLPSHPWTCSLLTPGPAPFSPLDLLPSHPLDLLSLLTPGPALPSQPWTFSLLTPWTCSLLTPGPAPFSPLDLLSLLTPGPAPFSPLDLLSLLTPGPALPCSWVHPQGRMLSGLGPGPQGLGHIQGAPQALLVLLCLGASSPPASLYLRPPKPSPGPSRSQPSSGRA